MCFVQKTAFFFDLKLFSGFSVIYTEIGAIESGPNAGPSYPDGLNGSSGPGPCSGSGSGSGSGRAVLCCGSVF